jgi:dTMP kinase
MTARGRFFSIEGGEGVGKSTQINALANMIRSHGHDVILTREPGGTEGAEVIRQLLLGGSAERWAPRSEALLFAAARSDHVERLIEPALASGKWVIADRFIDSSRAYHGIGSRGLLPDRTLVLRLDPKEAAQRAAARDQNRPDRIQGRAEDFHSDVDIAFVGYAESEPRVRLVDASGTAEDVTARLVAQISDLLAEPA